MTIFLTMLLKPLVAFGFLFVAAVLSRVILRVLPPGRLKRFLSISWKV